MLALATFCLLSFAVVAQTDDFNWESVGGSPGGIGFADFKSLNKQNIKSLSVEFEILFDKSGFENSTIPPVWSTTPIVVASDTAGYPPVVAVCTPYNELYGIDPTTGKVLWSYLDIAGPLVGPGLDRCLGVASRYDPTQQVKRCRHAIYMATLSGCLIAVDAGTGVVCPNFGTSAPPCAVRVTTDPNVGITVPPLVAGDLIIVATTVRRDLDIVAPAGVIKAYDPTGNLQWEFSGIPDPTDPAYNTWQNGTALSGGVDVVAPMTYSPDLGLIFVSFRSPSTDYFGGNRNGTNEYSSSVVALNVTAGVVEWSQQIVRHDVWAYGVTTVPVVANVSIGKREPDLVVLVLANQGMLFAFRAADGADLANLQETPVPTNFSLYGDQIETTQRFPKMGSWSKLLPNHPTIIKENTTIQQNCNLQELELVQNLGEVFRPPSLASTISWPAPQRGALSMSVNQFANRVSFVLNEYGYKTAVSMINTFPSWCTSSTPIPNSPYRYCQTEFMANGSFNMWPCTSPPWTSLYVMNLTTAVTVSNPPPHGFSPPIAKQVGQTAALQYGSVKSISSTLTTPDLVFAAGTEDFQLWAFSGANSNLVWSSAENFGHPITGGIAALRFNGHERLLFLSGPDPRIVPNNSSSSDVYGRLIIMGVPPPAPPLTWWEELDGEEILAIAFLGFLLTLAGAGIMEQYFAKVVAKGHVCYCLQCHIVGRNAAPTPTIPSIADLGDVIRHFDDERGVSSWDIQRDPVLEVAKLLKLDEWEKLWLDAVFNERLRWTRRSAQTFEHLFNVLRTIPADKLAHWDSKHSKVFHPFGFAIIKRIVDQLLSERRNQDTLHRQEEEKKIPGLPPSPAPPEPAQYYATMLMQAHDIPRDNRENIQWIELFKDEGLRDDEVLALKEFCDGIPFSYDSILRLPLDVLESWQVPDLHGRESPYQRDLKLDGKALAARRNREHCELFRATKLFKKIQNASFERIERPVDDLKIRTRARFFPHKSPDEKRTFFEKPLHGSNTCAIVIPFYNESRSDFNRTIKSFRTMLQHPKFLERWITNPDNGPSGKLGFHIVIVMDGWFKADESMRNWAKEKYPGSFWPQFLESLGPTYHKLAPPATVILDRDISLADVCADDKKEVRGSDGTDDPVDVKVTLVIKADNRRKHNSHEWFFQAASEINAAYCFATDCGTAYEPDMFYKLFEYLRRHPECIAVTGRQRVMSYEMQEPEKHKLGISESFSARILRYAQMYDYEASLTSFQGGFCIAGFLPVIPGPCGLYRFKDGVLKEPVRKYFETLAKDPEHLGLVGANLNLAEDRILSAYAVFLREGTQTPYTGWVDDAIFYFEAETNPQMLLGQRRRWLNGTYFGYQWAWNYEDSQCCGKGQFLTRFLVACQILQFWFVALSPSIFFSALDQSNDYWFGDDPRARLSSALAELLYVVLYLLFAGASTSATKSYHQSLFTLVALTNALMMLYLVGTMMYGVTTDFINEGKPSASTVVLFLGVGGPFFLALFAGPGVFGRMLISAVPFLVFLPTMIASFAVYAFARTWDLTWGNRPRGEFEASMKDDKDRIRSMALGWYAVIVFANLAVMVLSISSSANSAPLQTLVIAVLIFGLLLVQMGLSLLFWIHRRTVELCCARCCTNEQPLTAPVDDRERERGASDRLLA